MPQRTARQRRQIVQRHVAHGASLAATCAQCGVSRATLARWLARYTADPKRPLRARSRRPQTPRRPAWSPEELMRLCELTVAQPRWGRGRLTVALAAQMQVARSPATVGRMLAQIRAQCPLCLEKEGYHYRFLHTALQELRRLGLTLPPRPPRATLGVERDELRREQAAILAEAQALLRQR